MAATGSVSSTETNCYSFTTDNTNIVGFGILIISILKIFHTKRRSEDGYNGRYNRSGERYALDGRPKVSRRTQKEHPYGHNTTQIRPDDTVAISGDHSDKDGIMMITEMEVRWYGRLEADGSSTESLMQPVK